MRKYILYIVMVTFAITSCATRKAIQMESEELHSTEIREESAESEVMSIDTTKVDEREITVTEIEFFFPDSAVNDGNAISSSIGAVRKIKRTTIKATAEQKGISNYTTEIKEDRFEAKRDTVAHKKNMVTKRNSGSIKYVVFAAILSLLTIGIIIYKRRTIVGWIVRLLAIF